MNLENNVTSLDAINHFLSKLITKRFKQAINVSL